MIRTLSIFSLAVVVAVIIYGYALNDQISDIKAVCSLFPVGADIGDLEQIEKNYSVKLMGTFNIKEKPGAQQSLFCAVLTMCDTSCWVEYKDNRVIRAGLTNL